MLAADYRGGSLEESPIGYYRRCHHQHTLWASIQPGSREAIESARLVCRRFGASGYASGTRSGQDVQCCTIPDLLPRLVGLRVQAYVHSLSMGSSPFVQSDSREQLGRLDLRTLARFQAGHPYVGLDEMSPHTPRRLSSGALAIPRPRSGEYRLWGFCPTGKEI